MRPHLPSCPAANPSCDLSHDVTSLMLIEVVSMPRFKLCQGDTSGVWRCCCATVLLSSHDARALDVSFTLTLSDFHCSLLTLLQANLAISLTLR